MTDQSILGQFKDTFKSSSETLPPRGNIGIHQKALFLFWFFSTVVLAYRSFLNGKKQTADDQTLSLQNSNGDIETGKQVQEQKPAENENPLNKALLAVFTCGWILFYYFFCDYLHYFSISERKYNRDLFMFLCLLLFAVAIFFTTRKLPKEGKLLNREQTEEWKGWMQVMFVWYHYFKAAETYNAVRIYIACYVWMTGFGNFSFFWIRKDFSVRRVLKMLFRLNFLVVLTSLVMDNDYMLYYICPMHTFWFISVYLMMRPFNVHNENKKVMISKFVIYFILVFILFDVNMVADTVFKPLSFILSYKNSLHEWVFRSGLDHYATFIGMLCAYNHPNAERVLAYLNNHRFKLLIHSFISIVLLGINVIWYKHVFILDKYSYNKLHPYTSFIPILTFIYFRNISSWLRNRYLMLFTFLGKITLETYISQLHVYLQDDAKAILVYIPGYPLMNFSLNTVIYLYLSNQLFDATITLNDYIFPAETRKMCKNLVFITISVLTCYLILFLYNFIG